MQGFSLLCLIVAIVGGAGFMGIRSDCKQLKIRCNYLLCAIQSEDEDEPGTGSNASYCPPRKPIVPKEPVISRKVENIINLKNPLEISKMESEQEEEKEDEDLELTRYKMRTALLEQALRTQRGKVSMLTDQCNALEDAMGQTRRQLEVSYDSLEEQKRIINDYKQRTYAMEVDIEDARVQAVQATTGESTARAEADNAMSRLKGI
jgi:hypothetical protein